MIRDTRLQESTGSLDEDFLPVWEPVLPALSHYRPTDSHKKAWTRGSPRDSLSNAIRPLQPTL